MILSPFCLLSPTEEYKPDVLANLSDNLSDLESWLQIIEKSIPETTKQAAESQLPESSDARERSEKFAEHILNFIQKIREDPVKKSYTVRFFLDFRERLLNDYGFDDIYLAQKLKENNNAVEGLKCVLTKIDEISNDGERLFMICKGMLVGNVWETKQMAETMGETNTLSFSSFVRDCYDRPWLVDGYDAFSCKVLARSYSCVAIFVDNSGADFFLGVIPFARELIRHGSKVIVITNLKPSLKDMTYNELLPLIDRLKDQDDILNSAIEEKRLLFTHNGQGSPCLDLRNVNSELNKLALNEGVDLVVFEGTGRAVHTNYNTLLSCDSLKAAIIKNKWLAAKMGGNPFSVVFKFDVGTGPSLPLDTSN